MAVKNPQGTGLPALKRNAIVRVYVDGGGTSPDGTGSCFAWIRADTGERKIHYQDGLTNNQAEYLALKAALEEAIPANAEAKVFSDSQLVVKQFNGLWNVMDEKLGELLKEIQAVIETKGPKITLTWVPRNENYAGKLLEDLKSSRRTG